jgi:hypothetical protein
VDEPARPWTFLAGRRGDGRGVGGRRTAILLTGCATDEDAERRATLLTRLVSELAVAGLGLGPRMPARGLLGAVGSAAAGRDLEEATSAVRSLISEQSRASRRAG